MADWKRMLKADSTDWLLEEDNPSVRYYALTDIPVKLTDDPLVKKARKEIMQIGAVPKVLSKQKEDGYWETAEDFYIRTKYRGTVWQLMILAELGADKDDTRIKKACEFILRWSQDHESGGFSYRGSASSGGFHSAVLPCLTGNMVWSLLRFGYFDDPRVQHGIDWIVKYQRFDDAVEKAPEGWPYDKREPCWGKHTCHMGVVKILKALAEIPIKQRTQGVNDTIENAAEYLLKHYIQKRSHDLSRVSKPGWLKFGFPLMYNTDVLEILGILTGLGYRDSRMQEALELLISKQDEQGRWKLESTYNGRFQVNIEQKGKPSKWITLNALRVLKGFYD